MRTTFSKQLPAEDAEAAKKDIHIAADKAKVTLSLASSTGWIEAVQGELEMSVSMQLVHIHGVLRVVVLIVVQPVHLKPKCELLWCHIMMASCVYMWQVALDP